MADKSFFDVAVVGLGPSGMFAAALLAQRGRRIAVIERWPNLYGLPRAGHVDHEIVRVLQDLGVHEQFLQDAFPIEDYRWYNANREVILSFPWGGLSESGYNSDYMMYQPVLEDAVFGKLAASPSASLYRGFEVGEIKNAGDRVSLKARRHGKDQEGRVGAGQDEAVEISARYVVAADGAGSAIRRQLGISRDEREFNSTWIVVDVRVKKPLARMNPHQICDPRRPAFISPLGKRHHRFEWCILPTEQADTFSQPQKAWSLLAEQGVTPDDVEIVRQQLYTFEARVATRWRAGRVLLVGDAAHTMPPFMGQGACSGIRDAANLSWKLDLILGGLAPDALLDSYQAEREPHTRSWIDISILSGDVSCTLDPAVAAQRDAALRDGTVPPMPEFPRLTAGLLALDEAGGAIEPAGRLFIQRNVEKAGQQGPFDDVVGRGFLLIGASQDPRLVLSVTDREFLSRLGVTVTWRAVDPQSSTSETFADLTGDYAAYFEQWRLAALLVRPDHYVFGGVSELSDLPSLVGRLRGLLMSHYRQEALTA